MDELVGHGANAFYFGYIPDIDNTSHIINLRTPAHANFPSITAAGEAISSATRLGAESFITINGPFYSEGLITGILSHVTALEEYHPTGYIVSDINMLLALRESFPEITLVVSSGAHVLNSNAVKYMKSLGVTKIILPRQLTTQEIAAIAQRHPDTDFEIFFKNEECAFLDGYCAYSHVGDMDEFIACNEIYPKDSPLAGGRTRPYSCGACALFDLRGLDRVSLKICGRTLPLERIAIDVPFTRRVLDCLASATSRDSFTRDCLQAYADFYGTTCDNTCYYEPAQPTGGQP